MKSIWIIPVIVSILILGTISVVPSASAVTLNPGDIIVADQSTIGSGCSPSPGCGGLIKVDPTTGVQTAIASGGFFFNPFDVVMDANGDLIVADPNGSCGCSPFGCGAIFRVDPSNGNQFLISSLGNFFDPLSIEIDANGDYIVLDFNSFGFAGALFNITPAGVRIPIVSGGTFQFPLGLAIESDGNFVIVDIGENSGIHLGDNLSVYRDSKYIARLEVIQVREDISAADLKDQWSKIKVGDVIR